MKTKNTRHLIITTSLALILCLATLFGTTFAWFKQEVKSASNTVTTASFDVNLKYSEDFSAWSDLSTTAVLTKTLDPGANTGIVYIKVHNANTSSAISAKATIGNVSSTETATETTKLMKLYYKTVTAATDVDALKSNGTSVTMKGMSSTDILAESSVSASGDAIVAILIELPEDAEEPDVTVTFDLTAGGYQIH